MVDKEFCMSSYLALRYIYKENVNFFNNVYHKNILKVQDVERIKVRTAAQIDFAIKQQLEKFKGKKIGLMLSGGMDSAILASYMMGCDAYTFRFLGGEFGKEELKRAESYAKYYDLNLHYVDIEWDGVDACLDKIMKNKAAPVHSIEPQIYQAAVSARQDDVEIMIIGNASDYIFGGMDGLLSKDWKFDEFMDRYIYLNPDEILKKSKNIDDVFELYRDGEYIKFISFLENVAVEESFSSYDNAFKTAELPYFDPYAHLMLDIPLDLNRIRDGESKYLIRELFSMKYPGIPIPEKVPMPRPVDYYFSNWEGPKRKEFKENLDMEKFTGNQKWQLYCLERFLNLYESEGR